MTLPEIALCRLPLEFCTHDLVADVVQIADSDWVSHFNTGYHDGGWSGVALRSPSGDARHLDPDHEPNPKYHDTPQLQNCAHIGAALSAFACPLEAVRLLRLRPGGVIREHYDPGLNYLHGIARLHIPLVTCADAEFYLDGKRVAMAVGECWYLDFDRPHRAQNLGTHDRIHLVIDCRVNDWLRHMLIVAAESMRDEHVESSMDAFAAFSDIFVNDPSQMAEFQEIDDASLFAEAVVRRGAAHGFVFTCADVDAAVRAGTRAAQRHRFVA